MIIKAVLFVAAIAMFTPHEPNVGFGSPGGIGSSTSSVGANIACKAFDLIGMPCNANAAQTKTAPDTIEQVRASFFERLQAVKAELRAARH